MHLFSTDKSLFSICIFYQVHNNKHKKSCIDTGFVVYKVRAILGIARNLVQHEEVLRY